MRHLFHPGATGPRGRCFSVPTLSLIFPSPKPQRTRPSLGAWLVCLSLVLVPGACDKNPGLNRGADDWVLFRNLAQARLVEVATPTQDFSQKLEERWKNIAPQAAERTSFRVLGNTGRARGARIIIGTPEDGVPSQLARRVGAEVIEGQGFRFFGRDFFDAGDAFRVVMEDPRREGMPLMLWFGNDLTHLLTYLDDLNPSWRPRLDVFDRGDLAFSCPLARDGVPDLETGVNYLERREAAAEHADAAQLGRVRVWANEIPNPTRFKGYVQAMIRARASTLEALDFKATPKKSGPLVEVYLSGKPEELSAIIGRPALSQVNRIRESVDALLSPGLPDDRGAAVAQATALAVAGDPAHPWMLQAIGVAASGAWWNHPLDQLVGVIVESGSVPTLEEIVDPASDAKFSPHVLGPLRGQLLLFLLDDAGPKGLRSLWRGVKQWRIDGRLRVLWRESLQRTKNSTKDRRRSADESRRAHIETGVLEVFRAGAALTDIRVGEDSNYLGEEVLDRFEELKGLGAKSFSVHVRIPLFSGPLKRDDLLPGVASASASDLALLSVLARGRAMGLSAILVLDPLAADTGPRADQAALSTPADWRRFFHQYLPAVQHYGFLAELASVDVLCLGRELRLAMKTAPPQAEPVGEEELRRESLRSVRESGWIACVRIARGVFRGALSLSARTPEQARRFAQWDLFDLIGVELWPVFDDREGVTPTLASATASYGQLLRRYNELAREVGRPLLVLQAGFPARSGSWSAPWRPRGELDPESQAKAYRALMGAVEGALADSMPLVGVELWTWPVGSGSVRGFAPESLGALDALRDLFALER